MTIFSKLTRVLRFDEIYEKIIYPAISNKFHFSEYLTCDRLELFLRDTVKFFINLVEKNYKSIFDFLKCHNVLLLAITGIAAEVIIKQLPIGDLAQMVTLKVNFCINSLMSGFWLGQGLFYVFQAYDLIVIEKVLREAKFETCTKATKKQFDTLAKHIQKLRSLESEIDALKKRFEKIENKYQIENAENEAKKTRAIVNIGRKIQAIFVEANNHYKEATKIISLLEGTYEKHSTQLELCEHQAKLSLSICGILLAFSGATAGLGLGLGLFSVPCLWPLAVAANVVIMGWTAISWFRLWYKRKKISSSLAETKQCDKSVKTMIQNIQNASNWATETKLKTSKKHAFLNDIKNKNNQNVN